MDRASRRYIGYERVYLTLREVADTPFHIQGDDVLYKKNSIAKYSSVYVHGVKYEAVLILNSYNAFI